MTLMLNKTLFYKMQWVVKRDWLFRQKLTKESKNWRQKVGSSFKDDSLKGIRVLEISKHAGSGKMTPFNCYE